MRVLLIFQEIAITETLIHGGDNVIGGKPVAQLRDEHDVGLACAREIQNSKRLFALQRCKELIGALALACYGARSALLRGTAVTASHTWATGSRMRGQRARRFTENFSKPILPQRDLPCCGVRCRSKLLSKCLSELNLTSRD